MTPEDVKQNVSAWASSGDGLELLGERSEAGSDFALSLRSTLASNAPVEILVLQEQGTDRVTLRHTASLASGSESDAQAIVDARPGSVSGTVEQGWSGTSVTLSSRVYHDGLSKNSFVQAAAEVSRTAELLGAIATSAADATAGAAVTAQPTPAQSTTPQAQAMPAPSFSPQPQPQVQPAPVPQPAAQPAWVPTHSVPPQGLRAWAAPDPAGPVVATLAPGLPIQVSEVRGAWARVICSNGWTGWIDGRIIGVAA